MTKTEIADWMINTTGASRAAVRHARRNAETHYGADGLLGATAADRHVAGIAAAEIEIAQISWRKLRIVRKCAS